MVAREAVACILSGTKRVQVGSWNGLELPRGKKKNVSKRFSTFRVRGFEAGVARVYNDFCLVCSVETLFSLSLCVFLSFFLIQFPLQRLRLGSTGGGYRVRTRVFYATTAANSPNVTYRRTIGYTAKAFLSSTTAAETNGTDAAADHKTPTPTTTKR